MQAIKSLLERRLSVILFILVAIQPVLDVFSYFLSLQGSNSLSTLLRFGLLAAVALIGFLLSGQKRVYLILYGTVALFWAAHMLNCFRIGYISPVQDTGNLLRMLNFPLYALTFITALRGRPQLRRTFYLGITLAFIEILLFTLLPWVLGKPVYTYGTLGVGMIGWFAIPNAQSAIIVLSIPFVIYTTYRSEKYPLYLLGVILPVALMFVTGTKLNFYSIFILCGAYIFVFVLQLGKKSLLYVLPLVLLLGTVTVFRHHSPMARRDRMTAYSQGVYDEMVSEGLQNSGADQAVLDLIHGKTDQLEDSPERQLERVRRAVTAIYSDTGVYGWRTKELNERFGMYNVMEIYNHTDAPGSLSDSRRLKQNYAKLVWREKDALTHLLGFEYSDFFLGENIYDLENDFPGVFYNTGYLGFALYLLFLGFFFYQILRTFAGEVQLAVRLQKEKRSSPLALLQGFWQGLRSFLTVEMGAVGMSFLLAVIAAQVSGNVLRRPNVTIYFAIAAACLFSMTGDQGKLLKRK